MDGISWSPEAEAAIEAAKAAGAVALALFFTVLDRPATYGLPVVAEIGAFLRVED